MVDGDARILQQALAAHSFEAGRFVDRSRRVALLRAATFAADAIALVAATGIAALARFSDWHVTLYVEGGVFDVTYLHISLAVVAIWLAVLAADHLYDVDNLFWGSGEFSRVARALTAGVVGLILLSYALKLPTISRIWTLLAWFLAVIFTCAGRASIRGALGAARRRGKLLHPALILGSNDEAAQIVKVLRRAKTAGIVPIGCLTSTRYERPGAEAPGVPLLGHTRDVAHMVERLEVDTVIIASTAFEHQVVARIVAELRDKDADVQLSTGLFEVLTSRVRVREIAGVPLISVSGVPLSRIKLLEKRAFDLAVASGIILLGTPLWLLLAVLVKLDSAGPVLYCQTRIGRDGVPFTMYKFRSMFADAERCRDQVADGNEASGPLFKMRNDPRTTRVGKWLRKFSIDEFPQLINVVRGDMSLVGPRPPLPEEAESYTEHNWRRMAVVPGMTGLWQISGRSELTFEEMVRLDLFYIENWSVGLDISLMLRTVPAVVRGTGAY